MKILPTALAGLVALGIILLALRHQWRTRKSGDCGQACGSCQGCPGAQKEPPVV